MTTKCKKEDGKKGCPFCKALPEKIGASGTETNKGPMVYYFCSQCWAQGPQAESVATALILWNAATR